MLNVHGYPCSSCWWPCDLHCICISLSVPLHILIVFVWHKPIGVFRIVRANCGTPLSKHTQTHQLCCRTAITIAYVNWCVCVCVLVVFIFGLPIACRCINITRTFYALLTLSASTGNKVRAQVSTHRYTPCAHAAPSSPRFAHHWLTYYAGKVEKNEGK